jgi:hypothetical protein
MFDAYADAFACSGWNACAGCGITGPVSEMVEHDGQHWHAHCLPVDMFETGARVQIKGGGAGVVTGHGQYAVFVRFSDGSWEGFLPMDLIREVSS